VRDSTVQRAAFSLVAVNSFQRPGYLRLIRRAIWLACAVAAGAQAQPAAPAPSACPAQPSYPLPRELPQLQALAERLETLSTQKSCLVDAHFHAWRGAVLMALGRPVEAVDPLERALMGDPDLPGAQMDLAQALAFQGDSASAAALLEPLRARTDLDAGLRKAIEVQLAALEQPKEANGKVANWYTRLRITAFAGADSNLNNAPSSTEITLTLPSGDLTFPLDPSSLPKSGGAALVTAQWQGIRPQGESVWVLQTELRTRRTGDSATGYEQADAAASWLQAPAAESQWIARLSGTHLRFGGSDLLDAARASMQRQFGPLPAAGTALDARATACRPTLAAEVEHRRYPSALTLNGLYAGGVLGLVCRPGSGSTAAATSAGEGDSFLNVEGRWGEDHPEDSTRAGGVYRRSELRIQWERPIFAAGRGALSWSSTRQLDSEPYSVLLGNVPRNTLRHALQLEASWPLATSWALVSTVEGTWQKSNITAFASRQRSFYLGLRWEL